MKKLKLFPPLFILWLLLCGCGKAGDIYTNYREIEQLQLIQTIGVDSDKDSCTLSVSSGKPLSEGQPLILARSASTFSQAMNSLQDYTSSEQLFFAHTRYILLGRDYAEKGVDDLLDFVERDVRMRTGTELFVLKNSSAKELITGPGNEYYDITEVLSSVKWDVDRRGDSQVFNVRETARSLAEQGAALVCAVRSANTEGSVFLSESGLTAVPDGYGILRDARLVGFLEPDDAEAASLLLGRTGTPAIEVKDKNGNTLILIADRGGAKINPSWNASGGLDHISLEADISASIAEIKGSPERVESREYISRLEKALSEDLKKHIMSVLDSSARLDADFLGLGGKLLRDNAENFKALPEDWLKNARFQVKVSARIDHSYDLGDRISTDGSDNK